MKVSINNKSRARINERIIISLFNFIADTYRLNNYEVSIAIVGDRVMRRLNYAYRGIDKTTDILSFEGEDNFLGELIIDYSQVKRQEPYFSKKTDREFLFVLVHGLLHLLSYDDANDTDRLIMINKGKEILNQFFNK